MAHTDTVIETKWTQATKDDYFKEKPWAFAGPDKSYPIRDKSDVGDAWGLAGHADNPDAVRAKIKAIAKRLDFLDALPDTAKRDDAKESLVENDAVPFQPKPRIAQLKVRFLSDDAISRNGRQYPADTVNRLVSSGQNAVTSGKIINAYICHAAADEDNPLVVSGKATQVYKEGNGAYALFDIPDTTTGRDMVSLLKGGYIPPTMSLRASNAEMKVVKGKGTPQVVGNNITLSGIDFTGRPGIEGARIEDLILEHVAITNETPYQDSFYLSDISLITEEDGSTMAANKATAPAPEHPEIQAQDHTQEDANQILKPLVSGDSQGVDDSTPGSAFTKTYPQLHAAPPEGLMATNSMEESRQTHDHIAAALGMACAPKTQEAGRRKFSKATESHMVAIHDMHAGKLGLDCLGSYQQMATPQDPTDDGDDSDNMESVQPTPKTSIKEIKPMSLAEAKALLEAEGYTAVPPKSETEKLQEAFEAKLAAQQVQFEAMMKQQQEATAKLIAENQPVAPRAQRKTLVESTTNEQQPFSDSPRTRRTRIQENLMKADWQTLADRSAPLPEGVTPEMILEHFGQLMLHDYQQKWGNHSIRPSHS